MIVGLQELNLGQVITAIGGLGTAAFGVVDAAKASFKSINRIGFAHIRDTVAALTPNEAAGGTPVNVLPQAKVIETLEANWINGTDLASQKAIAKSLVKLHLSAGNAPALAAQTNVDPAVLTEVAVSIVSGTSLTQQQNDVLSRFDLIVTANLDEAYQIGDQTYRNWTRALAAVVAVGLSLAGGWSMVGDWQKFFLTSDFFRALLVGLLATPLAPIAKDLSSALASAVNTLQLVKK